MKKDKFVSGSVTIDPSNVETMPFFTFYMVQTKECTMSTHTFLLEEEVFLKKEDEVKDMTADEISSKLIDMGFA